MAKIKKLIEDNVIHYPATITDAVKNPNNGKTVTEELSELGSKVLTNSFEGKGIDYSSIIINGLKPSCDYKIELQKIWDISNIVGIDATKFHFVIAYFVNGEEHRLIEVRYGNELNNNYSFTTPSAFDYIKVGGRAEKGEIVYFSIIEISDKEDFLSAYLGIGNSITEIVEGNERGSDLVIKIRKEAQGYDFYTAGITRGVYKSRHYSVSSEFVKEGNIEFVIPSGKCLVVDKTDNISIKDNSGVEFGDIVLASCSFGNFVYGAFKNIIDKFRSESYYNELNNKSEKNYVSFVGRGSVYSDTKYYNLEMGHTYRITLNDNVWGYPTEVSETSFIINVSLFHKDGTRVDYYRKYPNEKIDKTIEFTILEKDDNIGYVQFGGRANNGVKIEGVFEDITNTLILDKSLRSVLGNNVSESGITIGKYYTRISSDLEEVVLRDTNNAYCLSPAVEIKEGDEVEISSGFAGMASYYPVAALLDSEKNILSYISINAIPRTWRYEGADKGYKFIQMPFVASSENVYVKVNGIAKFKWNGLYKESSVADKEENVKEEYEELFIGDLVNADTNGGDLEYDDEVYAPIRVVTKNVCCLPYEGITIHATMPEDFNGYFWVGGSNGVVNKTLGVVLTNGSSLTFEPWVKSYRFVFRRGKDNKGVIDAADVQQLIDEGKISFKYKLKSKAVERNISSESTVLALKRILLSRGSDNTLSNNGMNSMATFGHISDLHGDATRLINCFDLCDNYKVDGLFGTGDMTMYRHQENCTYQDIIAKKYKTPYMFCIGNHEAYPSGITTLYEDCMENLANTQGYYVSDSVITNKCYYFKDFPEKSIRVIAINYYENGTYSGMLGQEQITWFINTLLSTPQGYGVIIMLHSPEDKVIVDTPYDVFRQKHRVSSYQEDGFFVGNRPISKIIDAFISRTSISNSYTESNGELVSVEANFSSIDSSTEFIAYVCGHRHEDWIGYYANSINKQLCLDITSGIALYGDSSNSAWSNQSDLPRGGEGVTQDAINIYAIDRLNGVVKVVRIGANRTETFEQRDCMIIPYK